MSFVITQAVRVFDVVAFVSIVFGMAVVVIFAILATFLFLSTLASLPPSYLYPILDHWHCHWLPKPTTVIVAPGLPPVMGFFNCI